MRRDHSHEKGSDPIAIPEKPEPEVHSLVRSAERSPGASEQRKIQEQNRIGSAQSDFDDVVTAQISLHNPLFLLNQFLL